MLRLQAVSLLASCCLLTQVASTKNNDDTTMNLLMLGNGFSEAHHMEETLAAMLTARQGTLSGDNSVYADRFEHSSANLTDYLGEEVSKAIGKERQWTWVTLQEQSEIPGFYPPDDNDAREDLWDRSLETVLQLSQEIQDAGATTVLLQTWGYFKEDPLNPDIYNDYKEMQDHITEGYERFYKEIVKTSTKKPKVQIAPCGMAFSTVYHDIEERGNDPLEEGSLFDKLYEKDEHPRKHPSDEGAYLCACVLFQTLTGLDVRRSTPPATVNLDTRTAQSLQDAAYRTLQTYGTAPAKQQKAYRPEGHQAYSNNKVGVANFFFAFLLGGGVLAGWIASKWQTAAGTVRTSLTDGSFYKLAPSGDDEGGNDNNMLMELIRKTEGPQWINPV